MTGVFLRSSAQYVGNSFAKAEGKKALSQCLNAAQITFSTSSASSLANSSNLKLPSSKTFSNKTRTFSSHTDKKIRSLSNKASSKELIPYVNKSFANTVNLKHNSKEHLLSLLWWCSKTTYSPTELKKIVDSLIGKRMSKDDAEKIIRSIVDQSDCEKEKKISYLIRLLKSTGDENFSINLESSSIEDICTFFHENQSTLGINLDLGEIERIAKAISGKKIENYSQAKDLVVPALNVQEDDNTDCAYAVICALQDFAWAPKTNTCGIARLSTPLTN